MIKLIDGELLYEKLSNYKEVHDKIHNTKESEYYRGVSDGYYNALLFIKQSQAAKTDEEDLKDEIRQLQKEVNVLRNQKICKLDCREEMKRHRSMK